MPFPLSENEGERLEELRRYEVLDTPPEPAFDRITNLAAALLGTPWAFVSLVDEHRQWFKARCGLDATETDRALSFCAHAILGHEVLVVPDATLDPRFADNPLVTGSPHLRFYAGAPLITPGGHRLGTLCVAGPDPRDGASREQLQLLSDLATLVVDELELRICARRHEDAEVLASRLADLVQCSNEAILGKSLDGTIESWNPAAQRLYGYTAEEVRGRNISLLVPPERLDEVPGILARIAGGEAIRDHQTVRMAKDGRRIDVSLSISPISDGNGSVMGASIVARDVSAEKRLRQELSEAHDEALKASRAKSAFLATVSHEIRTPMNGVIGTAGLLLGTHLTVEQREYAEMVLSSGEALLTVINDILDFSKIEAGKLELEVLDFDVRTVVEEVLELLAERAHNKGLELASLVDPPVPLVARGDPGRLRQVLINLVGNAVKFTDRGEVVVHATPVPAGGDAVVLRFEVRDTGIGISSEAQPALFASFSQAEGSTTRRYGGTGLGLAISKQLVELMGGTIGVDSEPGRGSVFTFTVRLQPGPPAAAPLPRAEHVRMHGLRVLGVDDNEASRLALQQVLRTWGMHADVAESGEAALAVLEAAAGAGAPYDVALLDSDMPDADGITLARRIRARPALGPVRLVVLTSYVQRGDPAELRRAGIDGYLVKPLRRSSLYDCLATVVGLEGTGGPAPLPTETAVQAPEGKRRRVLVVDDNAVNQKVAVRMLERLGYVADVAGNGLEAVAAVQGVPYDAVLMDCQMPEMDGFEATLAIRALDGPARHVPVVAMTAGVLPDDQERSRAAKMDDFVAKPVTMNALSAALERWAGGVRTTPGGAPAGER